MVEVVQMSDFVAEVCNLLWVPAIYMSQMPESEDANLVDCHVVRLDLRTEKACASLD